MDKDKNDLRNLVGYNTDNNMNGQNHNNGMVNKKKKNIDELTKLRNLVKKKTEIIKRLLNTKQVI